MKRIVLLGLLALGSTSALSQQSIKARPLGVAKATSKELLGSATLARHLPNGSVIVNDAAKRRLLLLDSTLQGFVVIADSTSGSVNGYGQRPGALIPYVADSTLYFDATAGSLLVIDPIGKVVRVMSPPRPSDNNFLANTNSGFPGFDAKGRMVYRSNYPRQLQQLRDGSIQAAPAPDTAPIIRVDLDTRKADTVGVVKLARTIMSAMTMPSGGTMMMGSPAPLQPIDDWALLSDGSLAVLRGRDYHIDWILPDGTKKTTERISFDWMRLTDDLKLALIDSITKARANMQAAGPGGGPGAPMITSFGDGGGMRVMIGGGDGGGGGGGGRGAAPAVSDRVVTAGAQAASAVVGSAPVPPPASATAAAPGKTSDTTKKNATDAKPAPVASSAAPAGDKGGANAEVAKIIGGALPGGFPALPLPAAADLPDYMPPFTTSSARPDADAHLWVRTTTPGAAPGNVVYDVINNKGELTDRVDVPKGMSIVGFGRGGIVYLTQREGYTFRLIRATVH
jgi:hypothetical protein